MYKVCKVAVKGLQSVACKCIFDGKDIYKNENESVSASLWGVYIKLQLAVRM